ncbi:ABC transporter ATP-binding protein [Bacillus sp. FJAT-42376]|uniref:ABC transporter ATP-binding protein n=1 Tax=Bacillus sp. FJAT-42376 TaxID=2014076 RepID=UPI000F4EA4D7|nr:ABC transporter ATP-binding protein [Bacillus sp. FJAT-42376]AZB41545.1 ABC transporter ATP-binding protein [Bacillus sp. FJAT-42376]
MNQTIECKRVEKVFEGDGIHTAALQEISITFQEKEFVSIAGPSGSGKSTLLSLLGTLDLPSKGDIFYGERSIRGLKKNELADFRFEQIGFVFQQFHLLPTLTALENILSPLMGRKVAYNKKERAEQLLEQVGLKEKANALPSQLSGGQQQRVAIARALINEPGWLLADEPTGNLDTETGEMVFELLADLNRKKGCGVIFVTHDPELAARARVQIAMKDGNIVSVHRENLYV